MAAPSLTLAPSQKEREETGMLLLLSLIAAFRTTFFPQLCMLSSAVTAVREQEVG
jgi:hypothetical protein